MIGVMLIGNISVTNSSPTNISFEHFKRKYSNLLTKDGVTNFIKINFLNKPSFYFGHTFKVS